MTFLQHKIYQYDNFFDNCHKIYLYVQKNYSKYCKYQDSGEAYFTPPPQVTPLPLPENTPEEWWHLIEEIHRSVQSVSKQTVYTKSKNLNAIIYEEGSLKNEHTDHEQVFFNKNGQIHTEKNVYTTIYFLNDNFDGGTLFFNDIQIEIKPKNNRLIIFPSHYLHSVKKIIKGTRMVVSHFWSFEQYE